METSIEFLKEEIQVLVAELSIAPTGKDARPLILSIFSKMTELVSSSEYDYETLEGPGEKNAYQVAIEKIKNSIEMLDQYSKESEDIMDRLDLIRSSMDEVIKTFPTKEQNIRMSISDSDRNILVDEYEVPIELEFTGLLF